MNRYKKFTQYLVENHPLLWHSKLLQMLVLGIGLNLFSFLAGYSLTNVELLKTYDGLTDFIKETAFGWFLMILFVIAFALWALSYFRNNSIKNFYPTDNFYIIKLFSHIFLIVFVFGLSWSSFTLGVEEKTKNLFPKQEVEREIDTLNQAYPLYGFNLSYDYETPNQNQYSHVNRAYPDLYQKAESYDVLNVNYTLSDSPQDEAEAMSTMAVGKPNNGMVVSEEAMGAIPDEELTLAGAQAKINQHGDSLTYLYSKDGLKKLTISELVKASGGFKMFDNSAYVYYRSHEDTLKCSRKTIVDEIYNINLFEDLQDNHLLNYSDQFIVEDFEGLTLKEYSKDFAPVLYKWVSQNDKTAMLASMESVQKLFSKYQIKNKYKPEECYNYWQKNKFVFNGPIYDVIIEDNNYDSSYPILGSAISQLKRIYENVKKAYIGVAFEDVFGLFLFSLFAAFVLVLFEFANRTRFLIAVPVAGALMIACGAFGALLSGMFFENQNYLDNKVLGFMISGLVFSILIFSLTAYGFFSYKLPKKVFSVLYYMSYAIFPFFFLILYGMIIEITQYEAIECGHPIIKSPIEFETFIALGLVLISYFFFTFSVKKYLSRVE
ncbi:MAG: hypothetical protein C4K58_04650 [Flavobacteriaceae bacterium]|nr:MAG: hypothetical protein C4K58_04650 [Flavobacteriaceae bacterium]